MTGTNAIDKSRKAKKKAEKRVRPYRRILLNIRLREGIEAIKLS